LKDPDVENRRLAAWALGKYGAVSEPVVPEMIAAVKKESADNVRGQVLICLGMIGPSAKAAVPEMIRVLQSKDAKDADRTSALHGLKGIGKEAAEALPVIRQMLLENHPETRVAAAQALQSISTKPEPEAATVLAAAGKQPPGTTFNPSTTTPKTETPMVGQGIANYSTLKGKTVTWGGTVGKNEVVRAQVGTTTYEVKIRLKSGVMPSEGTAITYTGTLNPGVIVGDDYVYAPDGKATRIQTVYLTVTDAQIIPNK
jgi:hypothetical protein